MFPLGWMSFVSISDEWNKLVAHLVINTSFCTACIWHLLTRHLNSHVALIFFTYEVFSHLNPVSGPPSVTKVGKFMPRVKDCVLSVNNFNRFYVLTHGNSVHF
jgi:hypothetical protein